MSGLVYQNNNIQCGWAPPSNLFTPQITSLSSYYSPAATNSLVVIFGNNFYSYSVVNFSSYRPTFYFINSNQIEFYVPSGLTSGTYTIQVFNGSIGSNIVNYTIDNSSGYWLLNSNGSITNTNNNGLNVNGALNINGSLNVPNGILTPLLIITTDNATISSNYSGGFVEIGSGTITNVNLFAANTFGSLGTSPNAYLTIWNNNSGSLSGGSLGGDTGLGTSTTITITSRGGNFLGPNGTNVTTITIAYNTILKLYSDSYNWIVVI
jgi:hypothetical protein